MARAGRIVKGTLIIGGAVAGMAALFGIAAENIGKNGVDRLGTDPHGTKWGAAFLRATQGIWHLERDAYHRVRSFAHKSSDEVSNRLPNALDDSLTKPLNGLAAKTEQLHQKYKPAEPPPAPGQHLAEAPKTTPQGNSPNEVRLLKDYVIPARTSPGGITTPECIIPQGKELPFFGTRDVGGQTQYKVDLSGLNCKGYTSQWVPADTATPKQAGGKPQAQQAQPKAQPPRVRGPSLNA